MGDCSDRNRMSLGSRSGRISYPVDQLTPVLFECVPVLMASGAGYIPNDRSDPAIADFGPVSPRRASENANRRGSSADFVADALVVAQLRADHGNVVHRVVHDAVSVILGKNSVDVGTIRLDIGGSFGCQPDSCTAVRSNFHS